MRERGGEQRGLWLAQRPSRRRVVLALVALAVLVLPVLLPAAPAKAPSDPWWGPSDRASPTDGWAVRVPIVVENTFKYTLQKPVVAVDIDFGKLLVKAGWTNQTVGADARLRGFTLDVDSLRVVEYQRGFATGPLYGAATKPTPHTFYKSPFEAERYREFDAARNPAGTLLFQVAEDLAPGQKRYYYVYANPLEYGDMAPPKFELKDTDAIDAFLWGSRGTVYYGYEPAQEGQKHFIEIRSVDGLANVQVFQYSLGQFVPMPNSAAYPNPLMVGTMGARTFVPANTPFKIVSDRPIVVGGSGSHDEPNGVGEAFGYVPSATGSFAGTSFDVFGFRGGDKGPVTAIRSGSGNVQVFLNGALVTTLTSANPTAQFQIQSGRWSTVTASGGEILLSMGPMFWSRDVPGQAVHNHQVPALTGGPEGTSFFAPVMQDNGFFRICPRDKATVRVVDFSNPLVQLYPEGNAETAPPAVLDPSHGCTTVKAPGISNSGNRYEYFSTKEDRYPVEDAPVPFKLLIGARERVAQSVTRNWMGHFGGLHGTDFHTEGGTGIFGVYNDTRITIHEETRKGVTLSWTNRTVSVSRDQYLGLPNGSLNGKDLTRYHIVSTKPIIVASTEPGLYPHARYFPGVPPNPSVTMGGAEFRGPLVELRSPETDGRQLFRSTGPSTPISFRLDVFNLGRWVGGENLPDDIEITCSSPAGWVVEGCARELRLSSGAADRLNVVVTPPADDVNATRTIEVTARSIKGNVSATFKLIVYVEIRYGVGMWFDVEGGRKTIEPAVGVDPAQTHTYNIVLKNTGSTQDQFTLRVEEPRQGWTQELLHEGRKVDSVRLDGGASTTLEFRVTAPDSETAPQNIVSISAQSVSSALAGDLVNTATRIRPKVNILLELDPSTRLAEPNQTATFNITVTNRGNDIFRILFGQDSVLPEGWRSSLSVSEIDLSPNVPFNLSLRVTPPLEARAGELATLKIKAETDTGGGVRIPGDEVSAVVVVRKVHNITTPGISDAVVLPGQTLEYILPLKNGGNGQDAVELLPGAVTPNWRLTTLTPNLVLPFNETAEMPVSFEVPEGTPAGAYNLTFTLRLSREAFQNLTIPVRVEPLARVTFEGADAVHTSPGRATPLHLRASNTGNVEGTFDFEAEAPEGWNVTFSPATATLTPGQSLPVRVLLNASREAPDGAHDVTLRARLNGADAGGTLLSTTLARPLVQITKVDAQGALRAGELVLVTAAITNRGAIAAENVSVALVADGAIVDRVVLNRVPISETKLATLSWVATGRPNDVKIVLDPEQLIVQDTREDTAAIVTFGGILGTPAPGAFLLLVTMLGLALVLRRRRS